MTYDVLEIDSQVEASLFLHCNLMFPELQAYRRFSVYFIHQEIGSIRSVSKTLQLPTRGEDIFQIVDEFLNDRSISWESNGISTDGAAAYTDLNAAGVKQI